MLMALDHTLRSKGMNTTFTSNAFIADSGATCHMRGSLEGMFNLKPYVTDIMVGNNEAMSSVSMGNYQGICCQTRWDYNEFDPQGCAVHSKTYGQSFFPYQGS
jgi:hypothetical protein